MSIQFRKAQKSAAKARIGLVGPSGSGKTWTSLAIATGLGARIALIDTERCSASLYADQFAFDVLEMQTHNPSSYIEAIAAAEQAGYDVMIIDSLSHAWMGKDGALELVDQAAKKGRAVGNGNSFAAWRDVTPKHNALIDAMLASRLHIIATMRAKTEWVLEDNGKGGKTPRKIGLAAVQRDGMEYEFTIVGDLNFEHELIISKTRWSALADKVISRPGRDLGERIAAWLSDGTAPAAQPTASAPPSQPSPTASSPSRPPLGTEAEVRAELLAMVELFGGRPEFERKVCAWPKSIGEARNAVVLAKQMHAQAVEESQTPFDDAPPEPLAHPIDEPAAAQPASAAPPQGRAPEAAPLPAVEAKLAVVPAPANGMPAGPRLHVSIQEFWSRAKATRRDGERIMQEAKELLGTEPGKLTPLQRAVYCAVAEADGTSESVALDLADLYGVDLKKANDEVWTAYLEVLTERSNKEDK